MKLGTVTEIKRHEYRVGLTPACAKAYVTNGHQVLVQQGAGDGDGFKDAQYLAAGGRVVASREEVFSECGMIVKVKEPQPEGMLLKSFRKLV